MPRMGAIVGEWLAGAIEKHEGTYLATRIFHVNFVSLFPSRSVLVLGKQPDSNEPYGVSLPIDLRSLFAAYGRCFPILGIAFALPLSLIAPTARAPALAAVAGCIAVLVAAYRIGRVSEEGRAQRRIYASMLGHPVDAAHLARADVQLSARLFRELVARATALDASTYRSKHDPQRDWAALVLDPLVRDPGVLAAAFTFVRAVSVSSDRRSRKELEHLHQSLWAKIETLLPFEPSTSWVTAESTAEASATATDARPADFDAGATERGFTREDGFDVTFDPLVYRVPPMCASCLAPTDRTLREQKRSVAIDVPYCGPCYAHALTGWSKRGQPLQGVAAFGTSVFVVVSFVRGLPMAGAIAITALLSLAATYAIIRLFPTSKRVAPATATTEGARIVDVSAGKVTLFCTSAEWARRLSEEFSGKLRKKRRENRTLLRVLPLAILFAPALSLGAWLLANPTLHIDNAHAAPLQIWIDGKRSVVAPPSGEGIGTALRLPRGPHVLGWSSVTASAPEHTTQANLEISGDHLYAPGSLACYYRDVTLYGKVETPHFHDGPVLPLADFYTFDRADHWFEDNPKTMEVSKGASGGEKVAIKRWSSCSNVVSPPCPEGEKERYWQCMDRAWTLPDAKTAADACADKTTAACNPKDEDGDERGSD